MYPFEKKTRQSRLFFRSSKKKFKSQTKIEKIHIDPEISKNSFEIKEV